MPNWCHNTLRITGDPNELKRLAAFAVPQDEIAAQEYRRIAEARKRRGLQPLKPFGQWYAALLVEKPLSFASFVPPPRNLAHEDMDDWCHENWGTKWDAMYDFEPIAFGAARREDVETTIARQGCKWGHEAGSVTLTYRFLTAWEPPLNVVDVMAASFPTLNFEITYAQVGDDFAGRMICTDGEPLLLETLPISAVLQPEARWY